MSSNSRAALRSSTSNDTSTLRPRTTRLISYLEEGNEEPISAGGGQAISTSTSTLRRTSPSPSLRNLTATKRVDRVSSQTDVSERQGDATRRGSSTNGLWESWSQIQGIASTFLGNDAPGTASVSSTRSKSTFKAPAWMKQDRSYSSTKQVQKWGPRAPDKIGVGPASIEERQAMLQAKKREALLLAASDEGRDASGRFKRKGSNASITISSPVMSDDVLVYRHKVLPNDTMAGVTIKYSCQQEVFRKVNRLWPNDRIQIREHVLLPVDACAIRGRKVDRPDDVDLLGEEFSRTQLHKEEQGVSLNGLHAGSDQNPVTTTNTTASSVIQEQEEDYKHDSWVQLPKCPRAIEILRIPRTTLGYFPPARRKSNHNLPAPAVDSTTSSPRISFDALRHPPTHAAQQAQIQQQNSRSVSAESSVPQPPRLSSRQRSHSTMTASSQPNTRSSNAFLTALQGPGGVGSLRGLRTESSRPGPADDSLNQNFEKYLPSLALTTVAARNQYLNNDQRIPHARAYSSSQSLGIPRASMDSLRSNRSGRSNSSTSAFGAGVENWVKKIASATTGTTRPGAHRTNSDRTIGPLGKTSSTGIGIGIGGETGLGDLIELETNHDTSQDLPHPDDFDQGHDDHSEVRDATPRLGTGSDTTQQRSVPSARVEREELLLNERFPVRGKVTKAYGAKK